MKHRPLRSIVAALALATSTGVVLAATPSCVDAQQRRGRAQQTVAPWAPVAIGVRAGWDARASAEILGAQVRIPVLRSGVAVINPSADLVFLPNTTDRQYSVEGAFVPAGAQGGFFLTAGVGWRDTAAGAVDPLAERETFFGYIVGVGIRGDLGRLEFEVGFRWYYLNDTSYRPNGATLGVNLPLWRAAPASP